MRKWQELPESEKQRRIQNLKQNSPLTRCLERGLKVSVKGKGCRPEPHIPPFKLPISTLQDIKLGNREKVEE